MAGSSMFGSERKKAEDKLGGWLWRNYITGPDKEKGQ